MKKNPIGQSDVYVSELTLGCMSLGTDSKQAQTVIDRALDAGINHLDTADLYGFGRNEEVVGHAIKNKRDQMVVTSKVGNNFDRDKQDWFWDPSKEHIEQGCKDSLHRLGTDYIDFYMLHGGTIDDPIDETIEAFENLKQDGLIRAYGLSSIRPNVIREYVHRSDIDAVMMQYNLLDRRPEEEILDLLHDNHISVLTRGPLAKGMLSNHAHEQIAKKGKDGFLDYSHAELETIQQKLEQLAGDESLNALALNYVLKHPAVASAVFGASSKEQVTENTQFDHTTLNDETYKTIQNLTKPIQYTNHR
ncbi:aldo/keto reductase [Lentibacillus halophilus]|uniref:Aldo/keto reductase n=1 Tax=Lentibacillus halophilus TaxID=295065 RepID=A0ABN0ZD54_9BACI